MYLWLKMFHIIAMVAWFAGLFYLPRLFVYHTGVSPHDEPKAYERFCTMERKLYRAIIVPASVVTILLGIGLIHALKLKTLPLWLTLKITLVILLVGFQHYCSRARKNFAAHKNTRSERFFRILNEVPTLILIGVVYLAYFKPT